MRLSCGITPGPKAPELAALAEELGYHRAWFYDSPALYGDVWMAIARSLDRTSRIGVGTAVLVPSLRHVMTTAAAIGSVEAQAPGRLVVALGTGFTGRAMLGKPAIPWTEMRETVEALRALLRGEEAVVDGGVCRLMSPDGLIAKRPIATPIVLGVGGPRSLAIAKEIGVEGVMCAGAPIEGVSDAQLLTFGTVFQEGESFESPRVLDAIGPAIAVVYHGAYQAGGEAVDQLPGGAAWRAEVEQFPAESRHLYVHEGHVWEPTERDRRHMNPALGATTFSGTPEQLRERAAAFEAQGIAELVYAPMGPDVPGELRAMREAIG